MQKPKPTCSAQPLYVFCVMALIPTDLQTTESIGIASFAEVFLQRMVVLKQYLEARPERSIALVAHWNVFEALTGRDFRNCELHSCRLSDLLI